MKIEAATRLKAASKEQYVSVLKKCLQIDGEVTHIDDQCTTFQLNKYPDMSYIRFLDQHAGKGKRGSSNTDLIYTWTGLKDVGIRLYLPKDMSKKAHLEVYNRDEAYASQVIKAAFKKEEQ